MNKNGVVPFTQANFRSDSMQLPWKVLLRWWECQRPVWHCEALGSPIISITTPCFCTIPSSLMLAQVLRKHILNPICRLLPKTDIGHSMAIASFLQFLAKSQIADSWFSVGKWGTLGLPKIWVQTDADAWACADKHTLLCECTHLFAYILWHHIVVQFPYIIW